jgi:hypothetical protein
MGLIGMIIGGIVAEVGKVVGCCFQDKLKGCYKIVTVSFPMTRRLLQSLFEVLG